MPSAPLGFPVVPEVLVERGLTKRGNRTSVEENQLENSRRIIRIQLHPRQRLPHPHALRHQIHPRNSPRKALRRTGDDLVFEAGLAESGEFGKETLVAFAIGEEDGAAGVGEAVCCGVSCD